MDSFGMTVASCLIALVFSTVVEGQNATTLQRITVSEARLSQVTNYLQVPSSSVLVCAMKAGMASWIDLACYKNETCHLYEAGLPAKFRDEASDVIDQCFTKNGPFCITSTGIVEDGAEITEDCVRKVCRDSVLTGVYGSLQSCSDPQFLYVPGVGCLFHPGPTIRTYPDAVTTCATYGAQMMVPQNYLALKEYMDCLTTDWYWLGVTGTQWNDGTEIDSSYYAPGQPSRTDGCGIIYYDTTHLDELIKTISCGATMKVMCQLL